MGRRAFFLTVVSAIALLGRRLFLRDDTRYLQGIINAGSTVVRIPPGTYNVFESLVFSASTLRIVDGGNARLRWHGNTASPVVLFTNGVQDCSVSNMHIERPHCTAVRYEL